MSEYIEEFVSQIDVPLLNNVDITFFDQPTFHTSRLHDFLARIENFKAPRQGGVPFQGASSVGFELNFGPGFVSFGIPRRELGRQVSWMAQLWGSSMRSSLCLSSALKCLDVREGFPLALDRQDGVENIQWPDLLHQFTGLKDLHLRKGVIRRIAHTLPKIATERVPEVLPTLQNLFIEGPEHSWLIQEALGKFTAARQLSGLPVVVHSWGGRS